jgi:hypothetical protein
MPARNSAGGALNYDGAEAEAERLAGTAAQLLKDASELCQ